VTGTQNVIDACLRANVRRLVYVSSLGVLQHAGRRDGTPFSETSPLEPSPERRGAYTHSKLRAESLVARAVTQNGLRAVILRPGQIFGPGAERVPPNGVFALRGWNLIGRGELPLPLVYIDDLVDALLLAAVANDVDGRVFHVVDPDVVTQAEYLARWRTKVRDIPLRRLPTALFATLATTVELGSRAIGREPVLSRYRARSLRPLAPLDCRAAREALGWVPRIGARRGLALTFDVPDSVA
jgi:2-alkyl-3-oxoalkanoate reductase